MASTNFPSEDPESLTLSTPALKRAQKALEIAFGARHGLLLRF